MEFQNGTPACVPKQIAKMPCFRTFILSCWWAHCLFLASVLYYCNLLADTVLFNSLKWQYRAGAGTIVPWSSVPWHLHRRLVFRYGQYQRGEVKGQLPLGQWAQCLHAGSILLRRVISPVLTTLPGLAGESKQGESGLSPFTYPWINITRKNQRFWWCEVSI